VDYKTVFFECNREVYLQRLESFLASARIEIPEEAVKRTRRFMYYRYYRFSLPFGAFIESTAPIGYARLKNLLEDFGEITHRTCPSGWASSRETV
jgi:hypothetical protein